MYQTIQSLKRFLQRERKPRKTQTVEVMGLEEADLKNYLFKKFPDEQQHVEVTLVGFGQASSETRTTKRLNTDVFGNDKEGEGSKYRCRLPRMLTAEELLEIELLPSVNAPSTDVTEESSDEKNKNAAGYGRDHRSNRGSESVDRDGKTGRNERQSRQSERAADAKIRSDYMDGLN
ncbi:hypothetical protein CMUS01_12449 [Colletotrichum musicola]|uniref:Uncharacterized protein n=1 Tax=Colletotrichum musicola TaxID=2175873 RepID=A0A8H6JMR7_9PEZI|nr:hypothetical protein CMUS01_12449 [Colletotrichum musicola]